MKTENTELVTDSDTLHPSRDLFGLEQMGAQKISVFSDQTNSFNSHTNEKSESFVLDIDDISHAFDRERTPNSRITLQKSLSRKGSQRGGEKKTNSNAIANEDIIVATSSPKAGLVGNGTPESPVVMAVGSINYHSCHSQAHQHHITITGRNISSNVDSKWGFRRNSFRRSPSSLTVDPRKILFFFATLSSMGTILLILFTLSMRKLSDSDGTINWLE